MGSSTADPVEKSGLVYQCPIRAGSCSGLTNSSSPVFDVRDGEHLVKICISDTKYSIVDTLGNHIICMHNSGIHVCACSPQGHTFAQGSSCYIHYFILFM